MQNEQTKHPQLHEPPEISDALMTWDAMEFEEHEKGPGWYLTFVILAILVVIYELFIRDYFGAITLAIIACITYFFARLKPQNVRVQITPKGILLNSFYVPYANVTKFWFVQHPDNNMLHLETSAYVNKYVVVHLHEQPIDRIRALLGKYVTESSEDQEPLSHRVARFFRF